MLGRGNSKFTGDYTALDALIYPWRKSLSWLFNCILF
jgi:hypothetical protein